MAEGSPAEGSLAEGSLAEGSLPGWLAGDSFLSAAESAAPAPESLELAELPLLFVELLED